VKRGEREEKKKTGRDIKGPDRNLEMGQNGVEQDEKCKP